MEALICYSILDKCENLYDSYGEICVRCNCCGRFDKNSKHIALYHTLIRRIKEDIKKFEDDYFQSNLQQKNIASNIVYQGKQLEEVIKNIDFGDVIGGKIEKVEI